MNKNDGGPAFPRVEIKTLGNGDLKAVDHPGISLRDYFAAKAMQGFLNTDYEECCRDDKKLVEWAYSTADAMLKERNNE